MSVLSQPGHGLHLDVPGLLSRLGRGLAKATLVLLAATVVASLVVALRGALTAGQLHGLERAVEAFLGRLFG